MPPETPSHATDRLDDDDYPAYTMGRAAEMIGATPGFLRAIGEARLITRCGPRAATAVTPATSCASPPAPATWSTAGAPVEAACRIVILEDQLEEALRLNEELRGRSARSGGPAER